MTLPLVLGGSALATPPAAEGPITVKDVKASSALKKWKTFTFDASNLIDGKLDTSWQPAKNETYGVGQWIEFDLGAPYEISRIEISQGLQRVDPKLGDLYCRNNRLATAHVWLDDGTFGAINIGSPTLPTFVVNSFYRGWHATPGNEVKTAARRFRIIIEMVLEPVDWDDLAIAEVKVFGRPTKYSKVDPKTVVWDKPGAWPFWLAVSNYCVAKDSDYRARHCDELMRMFPRGHGALGAAITPFKPLAEAELERGAFQLTFDGYTLAFKRAADGAWRVDKSSKIGLDGKASGPSGHSYYLADEYADNPCWEKLGKKRPYDIGTPSSPDDDANDGSDDFGSD